MKVNKADLEMMRDRINTALNQPLEYTNNHMYLDGAYGGWKLSQVMPTGSGCRNITSSGYTTKKELYGEMRALLAGIKLGATA
tara:strand:+ start:705 stop:953 length:249 start_codon:yes stop_codon:yes gene_type:complete